MKFILLSLIVLGSAAALAVEDKTFKCVEDSNQEMTLILSFTGKKLLNTEFNNIPYKKVPKKLSLEANVFKMSIGSSSKEKSKYFRLDMRDLNLPDSVYTEATFSFGYPIQKNGKDLTLEESLMGSQFSENGVPYGKVRVDIEFDGGLGEDLGATWFYSCKRK